LSLMVLKNLARVYIGETNTACSSLRDNQFI
jgi:hypothetical protein